MAKVTLIRNILHEGEKHLEGEVLDVSDELKKELVANKLAKDVKDVKEAEVVSEAKASK